MTSAVEDCGRVVKQVVDCGSFDELRKKIFEELKGSQVLREYVHDLVDSSKTLGSDGGKGLKDRKKVLEDLQGELKDKLVERASRLVWEIVTKSDNGVAQEIDQKVHEALCRIYEEQYEQQQASQQQPQQASGPGAGGPSAQLPPAIKKEGGALPPAVLPLGEPSLPAPLRPSATLAASGRPARPYGLYAQPP